MIIEDLVCRDSKYFTWSKMLDMRKLPKSGNSSKFAFTFLVLMALMLVCYLRSKRKVGLNPGLEMQRC